MGAIVLCGTIKYVLKKTSPYPAWKPLEGSIISGIRYAEKIVIPQEDQQSTVLSGAQKLDAALRFVGKFHEHITGRSLTPKEIFDVREGAQILHNQLDIQGALRPLIKTLGMMQPNKKEPVLKPDPKKSKE